MNQRPSDIYINTTKEEVRAYLERNILKVIGFREPQPGELYLDSGFPESRHYRCRGEWRPYRRPGGRLILAPK